MAGVDAAAAVAAGIVACSFCGDWSIDFSKVSPAVGCTLLPGACIDWTKLSPPTFFPGGSGASTQGGASVIPGFPGPSAPAEAPQLPLHIPDLTTIVPRVNPLEVALGGIMEVTVAESSANVATAVSGAVESIFDPGQFNSGNRGGLAKFLEWVDRGMCGYSVARGEWTEAAFNCASTATGLGRGSAASRGTDPTVGSRDAAKVPTPDVPDDVVLVRGGTNTPDRFAGGSGVTADGLGSLQGVSVNSGSSVEMAAQGIPNKQIGVSTVGAVRRAGGTVVRAPTTGNAGHCLINGLTAEVLSGLFTPTIKNPCV